MEIMEEVSARLPTRRWTREEYYRAAELDLFGLDERLELLDGEIVSKPPRSPRHVLATEQTLRALARAFSPVPCVLYKEDALVLGEMTQPEPDILVARGSNEDYQERHPGPEDILLVVEVADRTLRADREQKGLLYARAGIPEYWIVNLPERRLEVYRQPSPEGYRERRALEGGQILAPLSVPGAAITPLDLLG